MSSYKPKIYRSQEGCCICKAKSSSSRFTDSGKYEEDCGDCFKLAETRTGEICNACVLIVKRWKKLPRNTGKNWAHVVDARTGPGTKNIFKQKKKEGGPPGAGQPAGFEKFKHKHVYKRKARKAAVRKEPGGEGTGHISDCSTGSVVTSSPHPHTPTPHHHTPAFLDNSYWRRHTVCCGVIYLGQLGETMLDQTEYRPCSSSSHRMRHQGEGKEGGGPTALLPPPRATSTPPSSASFSPSLTPSSIESLVEAELQAFQSMETETEDEEFYIDAKKIMKKSVLGSASSTDYDGDEGFCDRLDQKSERFRASLSLIASH